MASVVDELAQVRAQDRLDRMRALREHPVWAELVAHYTAKRDAHMATQGRLALRGKLSDRDAGDTIGYWRGVFAVLEGRDLETPRRQERE